MHLDDDDDDIFADADEDAVSCVFVCSTWVSDRLIAIAPSSLISTTTRHLRLLASLLPSNGADRDHYCGEQACR
jgi:hypothetical protein